MLSFASQMRPLLYSIGRVERLISMETPTDLSTPTNGHKINFYV